MLCIYVELFIFSDVLHFVHEKTDSHLTILFVSLQVYTGRTSCLRIRSYRCRLTTSKWMKVGRPESNQTRTRSERSRPDWSRQYQAHLGDLFQFPIQVREAALLSMHRQLPLIFQLAEFEPRKAAHSSLCMSLTHVRSTSELNTWTENEDSFTYSSSCV